MGSPKREITGAERASLLKLWDAGIGITQIAANLGVHHTLARRWLKEAGLSTNVPPPIANLQRPLLYPVDIIPRLHTGSLRMGLLGDPHWCSKWCRTDIITDAYAHWAETGVDLAIVPGNIVDGHLPRINEYEIVAHGVENQLDYVVKHHPHTDFLTYVLGAPDHEGWWWKNTGVDFVKQLADRRKDIINLGYAERDLIIASEAFRIVHPSGSSPQTHSWVPQKIIDKTPPEQLPRALIVGHHHTAALHGYYRGVDYFMCATCQEQSPFTRSNSVQATLGYWTLDLDFLNGRLDRISAAWKGYPHILR